MLQGSRNLTTRQGNIRNQFICEKHFDEKDFNESKEISADVQLNENEIMKRTIKESKLQIIITAWNRLLSTKNLNNLLCKDT